jgi:nicotinic acid mononucleotide adenylyltransferase
MVHQAHLILVVQAAQAAAVETKQKVMVMVPRVHQVKEMLAETQLSIRALVVAERVVTAVTLQAVRLAQVALE